MQTIQQVLWILGSSLILILGIVHLLYTLFTNKLYPRKELLIEEMKEVHPVLTDRTTIWKSWVGFNCSHSSGAMFFGLVNIYLVATNFHLILSDYFIITLDIMMGFYYCWLGWKYWFRTPFIGIAVMTVCYVLVILLSAIAWK